MHGGVLVGATGEAVVLAAGLGETLVLVADGLVELAAEVPGRVGCCDPHAASPAQAMARMVINRIVFDIRPQWHTSQATLSAQTAATGAPAIPTAIAPAMKHSRSTMVHLLLGRRHSLLKTTEPTP